MKLAKTITPLQWRVIVFLCLFVIISGAIGPRIINSDILLRDGFGVYGGVGKGVIFGLIAFLLLARHTVSQVTLRPWRAGLLGWLVPAGVCFGLAWISIDNLLAGQRELYNVAGAHAGLLLTLILVGISCIGPKNIQLLGQSYKRELLQASIIAVLFYLFLQGVYALWQPLASIVLVGVTALLSLTGLHAVIVPPHTLLFDKFGITIAEFCSGVESIALFTGLYAIMGLLDWKRLNRRRYFAVFPLALLVLFLLNIVRVYGLILAGYYINPQIAFSLFHTYAGMVFFILYSALFWAVSYKYLLKRPGHENSTDN